MDSFTRRAEAGSAEAFRFTSCGTHKPIHGLSHSTIQVSVNNRTLTLTETLWPCLEVRRMLLLALARRPGFYISVNKSGRASKVSVLIRSFCCKTVRAFH